MPKKLVSKKKFVGKSVRNREFRKDAMAEHLDRTEQSKTLDDGLDAPIAKTPQQWYNDPNRFDVPGVDARVDWRAMPEKQRLKELESPAYTTGSLAGLSAVQEERLRLQWQKKHPFYFGGTWQWTKSGYVWDGIKQYNDAKASGQNFGFDWERPESTFLDTYNLKRHDIYGLKFMGFPKPIMDMLNANGFYNSENSVMVLTDNKLKHGTNNRTIVHEIGHHIYDHSPTLQWRFRQKAKSNKDMIKVYPIVKTGSYYVNIDTDYMKDGKLKSLPMADVIRKQKRYLIDQIPWKDIDTGWKKHYREKGHRDPAVIDAMCDNEAFAEVFRVYRNGDLKRAIKEQKKKLAFNEKEYEDNLRSYNRYRGKTNPTEHEQDLIELYKKKDEVYSKRVEGRKAMVHNFNQIYNWMKEADGKKWYKETPKEYRFTKSSIRPVTVYEHDFTMFEADVDVLKTSKKNENQWREPKL